MSNILDIITDKIADVLWYVNGNSGIPECDKKLKVTDPPKYHLCTLDRNLKIHQSFQDKTINTTTKKFVSGILLMEGKASFWSAPLIASKQYLYSFIKSANPQIGNWLKLDAARKRLWLADYTQRLEDVDNRQNTQTKEYHLRMAEQYLRKALKNKNRNIGFDINRSLSEIWNTPPIHPIEGYFEIKLTLIQVLTITKPSEAAKLHNELSLELKSTRVLQAQGSNLISAEGYLHRLRLLKANLAFYQPNKNIPDAIAQAKQSMRWTMSKVQLSLPYLWSYGMSRMDLAHDHLLAKLRVGELELLRALRTKGGPKNFGAAQKIFTELLDTPLVTRKYGGFGNLGLQALAYLTWISNYGASNKQDAAQKFDQIKIGNQPLWQLIDSNQDFKEMLGLLVRQRTVRNSLNDVFKIDLPDIWDVLGNIGLKMDWKAWGFSPKNKGRIESEIKLSNYPTALERYDIILRGLVVVKVQPKLRQANVLNFRFMPGR